MADSNRQQVKKGTLENLEQALFLVGIAAFIVLSALSLGSILRNMEAHFTRKIILAGGSFALAVFLYGMSPRNQGRTMRLVVDKLDKAPTIEDFEKLQRNVGSAGFFNRIGLTGIPLAVALLALAFCGLVFLAQRLDYSPIVAPLLDLTKLTVGAFIGALTAKSRGNVA